MAQGKLYAKLLIRHSGTIDGGGPNNQFSGDTKF